MEPLGAKWRIKLVMLERFHWPADRGRTKLIVGDAPRELKSEAPAPQTFVGGVLGGFAVGGPVDNEADAAAPAGVVWVEPSALAREIQVGAGRCLGS